MADGGSKSESEEEPVLFTNTEQPLDDPTIAAVEMKVRMRKKDFLFQNHWTKWGCFCSRCFLI